MSVNQADLLKTRIRASVVKGNAVECFAYFVLARMISIGGLIIGGQPVGGAYPLSARRCSSCLHAAFSGHCIDRPS